MTKKKITSFFKDNSNQLQSSTHKRKDKKKQTTTHPSVEIPQESPKTNIKKVHPQAALPTPDRTRYVRRSKKIYNEKNVLEAAFDRMRFLFTHFDNVSFAISGGKDSGVVLQLANMVARDMHKRFNVMYIDFEAMYMETERFVRSLREEVKPNCDNFYWICLPFCEDNATSALNPEFITWDESAKDYWIREFPDEVITVDNNQFPFTENINDFDTFIHRYAKWTHKVTKAKRTAIVVGIRTDESLRRFLAVANPDKPRYQGLYWTTEYAPNIYNVYPIYDWKVGDVWGFVAKYDKDYNHVYEDMYKNGVPLSLQRICQPNKLGNFC